MLSEDSRFLKILFISSLILLYSVTEGRAQSYSVPFSGNNSITTCSGTIYDHAGTGNYSNGANKYTVIYPTTGNVARVSGSTSGETCCDFLYIYDGVGTGGTLLWSGVANAGTVPLQTSSSGPLTIRFTSDGSVTGAGFALTISCATAPLTVPYSGNNSYTGCSGTLYDHAGSGGSYSNNANGYTVLYPTSGSLVRVSGSTSGESCCDFLYIYDGVGTGGTLLWSGVAGSGTVPAQTSTSGPLTVRFTSDGSVTGTGFALNISCVSPPSYTATYTAMNTGSATWCAGETRTVSVTITNSGTQPWTDGGGEDFNIGVKWNADADYFVRVDAQNLAAGASRTYNLSVTAPATPTTNNLTFNVVREAVAWFGGPYTSPTINIIQVPSQPSTISGPTSPCQGSTQTYSVTNVGGVTYAWSLPSGWSGSSTTNSISVTVGSGSGNVSVTPSNSCGSGTARALGVSPVSAPVNDLCGSATGLVIGNSAVSGSLTCSNSESPFSGNGDVWYRFTPSCTGNHSISLTGLPDDKDLYVFAACGTTSSIGSSTSGGSNNENITQSFTGGVTYYIRVYDYTGTGGSFNIAVTSLAPPPSQPSAISGLTNPEVGSSQAYSVTNVAGVTYTWSFPSGWTITGGQGTNSATVTVGGSNGTVSVTPSNACGTGTARTLSTNIPNYRAKFISMNYGSGTWCAGTPQNVEVTIQNTGVSTWNSAFTANVGVKWNTNGGNWADYYVRTSAGSLAASQ